MFISLAGGDEVVIRAPAAKKCGSAHLVDPYVWECLESDTQRAFELHLMECSACLHSVGIERILRREIREQKTSCGIPCATRVRRIR